MVNAESGLIAFSLLGGSVQRSHDHYGDLSQPITELLDLLKRNLA